MKKKSILITLLFVGIVFISGCVGQEEISSDKDRAISACKVECNSRLNAGEDLNNGPCLLDPIPELSDWVCDVAHDPRQDIDNQPKNQCNAFREGTAYHFVEVNTNCEFIKTG